MECEAQHAGRSHSSPHTKLVSLIFGMTVHRVVWDLNSKLSSSPFQHNTVKIIYHLAWLCFIFFLQQCCLYWNIFTSKLELCKLSAKDMWTMIILMMHLFVVHFGAISWQCKRVSSINQFSFPSTYARLKRRFCFQNIRG